jgi:hypothetical protein
MVMSLFESIKYRFLILYRSDMIWQLGLVTILVSYIAWSEKDRFGISHIQDVKNILLLSLLGTMTTQTRPFGFDYNFFSHLFLFPYRIQREIKTQILLALIFGSVFMLIVGIQAVPMVYVLPLQGSLFLYFIATVIGLLANHAVSVLMFSRQFAASMPKAFAPKRSSNTALVIDYTTLITGALSSGLVCWSFYIFYDNLKIWEGGILCLTMLAGWYLYFFLIPQVAKTIYKHRFSLMQKLNES